MVDRESVRSNAKYLRNVRPVDPDEVADYVTGQPHPGVVRQVLREEAFDLSLYERDDRTFVPANDDPAPFRDWRPTALPDAYAFALEDLLVREYGANWHVDETGDRLRETIRRLKEDYFRGNPVEYDTDAALGYAVYHLPDYYAAVGYVLDDLTERERLPRRLRVLDVGAGVGGPALGLHDYLPDDAVVEYHAVEPGAGADVFERLVGETRRNFRATLHRETAEAFDPAASAGVGRVAGGGTDPNGSSDNESEGDGTADGESEGFDLVVFANVLSELDDPVAVVRKYLDYLAPDGTVAALAPADLDTSTGLRAVERAVAPPDGDVTVYSPTLRLWPGEAPSDRGWSFDVGADLDAPSFQRRLDEAGDADDPGTFVNTSVQFSYALLRTDGARRREVRADPDRHAAMAAMEDHVTNRVNMLAVKLSHDLSEGADANPLYKVGDGSERVEQYAVLTRESALNRALAAADYGDVLSFENVLVLWNDDEAAYNHVVDGETVVDRVA